jgi:hypothetical protein
MIFTVIFFYQLGTLYIIILLNYDGIVYACISLQTLFHGVDCSRYRIRYSLYSTDTIHTK